MTVCYLLYEFVMSAFKLHEVAADLFSVSTFWIVRNLREIKIDQGTLVIKKQIWKFRETAVADFKKCHCSCENMIHIVLSLLIFSYILI